MTLPNYTPAEVEAMKNGATVSKVLKDSPELGAGPVTKQVTIHTDEDLPNTANWGSARRVTAPGASEKIRGAKSFIGDDGKVHEVQKISAPNVDRFNQQAAARALKDIELREAADAAQQLQTPQSLHNSLQALDRQVRKLSKELSALKKEAKADG